MQVAEIIMMMRIAPPAVPALMPTISAAVQLFPSSVGIAVTGLTVEESVINGVLLSCIMVVFTDLIASGGVLAILVICLFEDRDITAVVSSNVEVFTDVLAVGDGLAGVSLSITVLVTVLFEVLDIITVV